MKKNIILVLVLLIVWGIYFWINYIWETTRKHNNKIDSFSFSKFNFNNIKANNFEIKNKKIVYSWTWEYITDSDKMYKFISDLKEIKVKDIASTNKSNFSKFWITSSWDTVKIDNTNIILWKNKLYYWEEYIKIKWDNKIYLINKSLKNILNKDEFFFRKIKKEKNISLSWSLKWTWKIIK